MAQITFIRTPTGKVGIGLFLVGIAAFLLSVFDPLFGPLAAGCIAVGVLCAALLMRRRRQVPHIDPRDPSNADEAPRPIEPR